MHGRFILSLSFLPALLLLSLLSPARAQFYAPDTEYHDRAQRHFVVEMARVLAWRANHQQAVASAPPVAEVTYEITLSPDRRTTWKIHWLAADGKPVRDAEVSYPETALLGGATWYRIVARQLSPPPSAPSSPLPAAPTTVADLLTHYWVGAETAQPSRAESLRAAFALSPEKDPAALAGALTHAALPGLASGVSLDGLLLARAAAWLCLAEQSVQSPTPRLDTLWAPLLFLSARENLAVEHWNKAPLPPAVPASARGWDFLLAHHGANDAFAFAAHPANRRWVMPLLAYESNLWNIGTTLPGVIRQVFGEEASLDDLRDLHDYAPFMARMTGVDGGRITEGGWPAASRAAWLDCLRQFRPDALDYRGYQPLLNAPTPTPDPAPPDPSLAGLADAAPLLNLGFTEGTGKLTPVAVATARDLLNFGWEMNGVQMGARWNFARYSWRLLDLADSIARSCLGTLDGVEFFFLPSAYNYRPDLNPPPAPWPYIKRARLANLGRLQEVNDPSGEAVANGRVFDDDGGQNALLWVRRCWLCPAYIFHQGNELVPYKLTTDLVPLMRRLRAEGGPSVESKLISVYARGFRPSNTAPVSSYEKMRLELLAAQTEPSGDAYLASWDNYDAMHPLAAAQELERLFWQRPGSDLPFDAVFSDYLDAHAYAAAKRFYHQAVGLLPDKAEFSRNLGARRFMLALMEDDADGLSEALRDSHTGSYTDMAMNVIAAANRDDFQAVAAQADECIKRYASQATEGSPMKRLKKFLPLIPALKDPAHADHAQALDAFDQFDYWLPLQWVLLRRAKLSTDDAVRFLGGPDTDPQRKMLVAYLRRDRVLFAQTYVAERQRLGRTWQAMPFVVVHFLRNDLLGVPIPADQPDLKPAGAQSPLQAFEAARRNGDAPKAAEATPAPADADALWKHIEELAGGPATPPATPEAAADYVQGVLAATADFSRRFPHDPRRWQSKMLGADVASVLARIKGQPPDLAAQESVLREVADAPDAPAELKPEARFTLIRLHLENGLPVETLTAEQEKEIAAFARDFPSSPHNGGLQLLRAQSLAQTDPDKADVILTPLLKDENPEIAMEAKGRLRVHEVMKKPLEMKFTALDGTEVDVSKLRGKVVLIDFWATWCPPCMAEVPEVVETYKKLHNKGFEIVGISLDEDKDSVLQVTRARGMTWPQYFDGKRFENEISLSYAITSIPRMWLLNKKGFLVNPNVRENLEEIVAKLIAE